MNSLQHLTETNSSWISEMYQRGKSLVEVVCRNQDVYLIETKDAASLDAWFGAESKGKWFHANKSELDVIRVYY